MSRIIAFLVAPLIAFAAAATGPTKTGEVPRAKDSTPLGQAELPIFTNEGFRSMLVRGSMDISQTSQRVDVTDMQLTVFSENAAARIESILIAPVATVLLKEKIASGEKSVRFIREDMEASAPRWKYDHAEKSISLAGGVKVVLQAELKDVLK